MLMRLLSMTKSSVPLSFLRLGAGRSRAITPAQYRRRLGLPLFEPGAQDGGEIADMLGGEEVVLHEALDVAQAGMRGVAEPHRDIALDVE